MSAEWIDISMPLSADMMVWPGNAAPSIEFNRRFEDGYRSISSVLTTNLHNGTHIDAPLHFTPGGATIEQLELDPFIGRAQVVDLTHAEQITADVLDAVVPKGTERLLMQTRNSGRRMTQNQFPTDFAALRAYLYLTCA